MLPSQSARARATLLSSPTPRFTSFPSSSSKSSPSRALVNFSIIGYMACSSLMLLTNKVAVYTIQAPVFILFCQMFTTALFCFISSSLNLLQVDSLKWSKIKPFSLVVFVFLGTIFANIKVLQYCNVETFIVFRASTPIVISIGDYLFLNRELPSPRSWLCLVGLVSGAYSYVYFDAAFEARGYTWILIWYVVFSLDQLYIKHVCNTVKMKSNWGRVYYTNLLSALPLVLPLVYTQELHTIQWSMNTVFALAFSCVLGLLMSYFAFLCRNLVAAAYFTVIGNVCKLLTVVFNFLIWDQHANMMGVFSLLVCLACAYMYKQAPKRKEGKDIET